MPHIRKRYALKLLKKRLGFFRVVSLQGPRQTGKSFLAREILAQQEKNYLYKTFDERALRVEAESNPDSFLERFSRSKLVALDEAQKVPHIFDAIKLKVDLDQRPGQYLLLGSTEFSRELKIRESLTGRLGRVRIYPFNLSETLSLPLKTTQSHLGLLHSTRVKRTDTFCFLENGGFPGVFHVRDNKNRESLLTDWLYLVLERDLMIFSKLDPDPDLARDILKLIAVLPEPNQASIAKATSTSVIRVKKHLLMLEQLFVIVPVHKNRLGSGKTLYYLCDPSLATYFDAPLGRKLQTWNILEILTHMEYSGTLGQKISYYRSARGGVIDFLVETRTRELSALKVFAHEGFDLRDFEIFNALTVKAKAAGYKIKELAALAPVKKIEKIGNVTVYPWEYLG